MYFILAALLVLSAVPFARKARSITFQLATHRYMVSQQLKMKRQRRWCAVCVVLLFTATLILLILEG